MSIAQLHEIRINFVLNEPYGFDGIIKGDGKLYFIFEKKKKQKNEENFGLLDVGKLAVWKPSAMHRQKKMYNIGRYSCGLG